MGNRCVERIEKISQDYHIFFLDAGSIKEINKKISEIKSIGKELGLLIINAHGSHKGIVLDYKQERYKEINKKNIHKLNLCELQADATIFLACCSTGRKIDEMNIAEMFQFYAGPYRNVIAANEALTDDFCSYDASNKTFDLQSSRFFSHSIKAEISIENLLGNKIYS